ncbi:MAG: helix-turn-helix domain-containing protein [Actinomycetota bacterium]|nr:helix-turn-helix domain-containing protein [Actinomycetota bacterium]
MDRMLHQIPEAAQLLGGMSRSTLYERIASGEIRSVKVGRRTYIAHDELARYVRFLTGMPGKAWELSDGDHVV